jgi:hypothetical protein
VEIMDITVDAEALAQQIREETERCGFTVKVWVPVVEEPREDVPETSSYPLVEVEGSATPMTIAIAIMSLEQTISQLVKDDDVKLALEILRKHSTSHTVRIDGMRGDNNDK